MAPRYLRNLASKARKHPLTWQYLFNLGPTLSYKMRSHVFSDTAQRVVSDLNEHGVAVTSVDTLLCGNQSYADLLTAIDGLESNLAGNLAEARSGSGKTDAIGRKVFNVEMLGERPIFDICDVYAGFALQDEILGIANSYLNMYSSLRYYNVWHTFATDAHARESQLWHRDREDFHVLKMFLYISDVDENSGPFNYVTGTHPKGARQETAPFFLEGGVQRSTDEQMAQTVPEKFWKKCTGKNGTLIFADTRGYHKGGLARDNDRIMYTCMFTSPASQSERLLQSPDSLLRPSGKEQLYALKAAFRP